MVILLTFVGVIGGGMTLALLWPYGPFTALLGMPLGASALGLAVSMFIAMQKSGQAVEPEAVADQPNALASEAN